MTDTYHDKVKEQSWHKELFDESETSKKDVNDVGVPVGELAWIDGDDWYYCGSFEVTERNADSAADGLRLDVSIPNELYDFVDFGQPLNVRLENDEGEHVTYEHAVQNTRYSFSPPIEQRRELGVTAGEYIDVYIDPLPYHPGESGELNPTEDAYVIDLQTYHLLDSEGRVQCGKFTETDENPIQVSVEEAEQRGLELCSGCESAIGQNVFYGYSKQEMREWLATNFEDYNLRTGVDEHNVQKSELAEICSIIAHLAEIDVSSKPDLLEDSPDQETSKYDCPISGCERRFDSRNAVNGHLQTHTEKEREEIYNKSDSGTEGVQQSLHGVQPNTRKHKMLALLVELIDSREDRMDTSEIEKQAVNHGITTPHPLLTSLYRMKLLDRDDSARPYEYWPTTHGRLEIEEKPVTDLVEN